MKSVMLAIGLIAVLVGFTACAKYPNVVSASSQSPTAQAPAPTR
jgi:hypothetical protein